jgi:hypothetical protein
MAPPRNTGSGTSETPPPAQADGSARGSDSGPRLAQIPELKDVLVGELAVRGS